MQTRSQSMLEATANVLVGYSVSVIANLAVLPAWGFKVSAMDAMGIGLVFTLISWIRSYALRRLFNRHG